LTLTPALCAILLRPTHGQSMGWLHRFFAGFNKGYDATENKYHNVVKKLVPRKRITLAFILVFVAGIWTVTWFLPGGFIPTEDQGVIYVNVTTPAGATVERTGKVLDEISAVSNSLEEVENISTLAGYSLITESAGAAFGMGMLNLKPWDKR